MATILVPQVPSVGLQPLRVGRNAAATDGMAVARLATQFNGIAGARLKCLGSRHVDAVDIIDNQSLVLQWFFVGHTSPNATSAIIAWDFLPSPLYSGAAEAYATLKTFDVSTSPASVTWQWSADPVSVSARSDTPTLTDYQYVAQEIPIPPDEFIAFEIYTNHSAWLAGITIYEVIPRTLNTATQTAIDLSAMRHGSPILDRDVTALLGGAATLVRAAQAGYWSWTAKTAAQTTSATYVNALDASYTAWNAGAPGGYCYTQGRGYRTNSTAPCICWCCALMDSGTGYVKWVRSGATVAEIAIGTVANYAFIDGILDGSQSSDKVDVLFKGDGTHTMSLLAAGMFPYPAGYVHAGGT